MQSKISDQVWERWVEVDQEPVSEDWTDEQQALMRELVRRSIFIEMEPGRGRRSLGPTWRWQLRRIYCPAFGASLKKNDAIKWKTSDLKYFLTKPQEKCSDEFEKRKKTSKKKVVSPYQRQLVSFLIEGESNDEE